MAIYERTCRDLMHDFASEKLTAGRVFHKKEAVDWFRSHYPKIKSNTVGMHVEGMSTNSTNRKHHPHIRTGLGWDLFYKVGTNQYRLWNEQTDPSPIYKSDIEAIEDSEDSGDQDEINDDDVEIENSESKKFAFEKDLQNYLVRNLTALEPNLQLYQEEDGQFNGIEYPVGSRRIDILAVGEDGAFVVIETKVSKAYDRVIGQILRYMGWIEKNLSDGSPVRGIIVASDISEDLKLAARRIKDVNLVEYEISFSLSPVK